MTSQFSGAFLAVVGRIHPGPIPLQPVEDLVPLVPLQPVEDLVPMVPLQLRGVVLVCEGPILAPVEQMLLHAPCAELTVGRADTRYCLRTPCTELAAVHAHKSCYRHKPCTQNDNDQTCICLDPLGPRIDLDLCIASFAGTCWNGL